MINRKAMLTQSIENGFDQISEGYPDILKYCKEKNAYDYTIYGNCGKNLLPYPFDHTTQTINGITFTDNGDGTVTANGTATATAQFFPKTSGTGPLLAPGTYTFSGCPKGGDWKIYNIRLTGFTADRDFGKGSTFTLTQSTRVGMSLTIVTGATVENLVFKPQIESGSTKTDYEPYKEVGESGKNLLPYPFRYHDIYGVKNGITVTDSGNSSITLNGTAAAYTVVYIESSERYTLAAGKYFLSGKPSNITGFKLTAGAVGNDGSTLLYVIDDGAGAAFDISEIANKDNYQGVTIAIRIDKGTVFDNLVLKPQLELGDSATEFEPYDKYVIPVTVSGKNLLRYPYDQRTKVINGITFTDNGDGTITANGTATANAIYVLYANYLLNKNETYVLSSGPDGNKTSYVYLSLWKDGKWVAELGTWKNGAYDVINLVPYDYDRLSIRLIVIKGNTVDNLIFKPQLELGETATDFEPYTAPKITKLLLDAPLGPNESVNYKADNLPSLPLFNNTSIIMTKTEVPPSNISVTYNTKVKGD